MCPDRSRGGNACGLIPFSNKPKHESQSQLIGIGSFAVRVIYFDKKVGERILINESEGIHGN